MKFSKPIELPFTCPINNRKFNTIKGVSVYITKTLHIDHEFYYNNYLYGEKLNCYFCGNTGRFVSIAKGYRDLCHNVECVGKSRQTYTVNGIMYKENCAEDEAKIKLNLKQKHNSEYNKERSKNTSLENSNFLKENSSWCIEFWLKKGYSKDDAELKLKEYHKNNGKALSNKLKTDDIFREEFKNKCTTNINYWINLGYNIIDAQKKLTERQKTFSLEKCIEKYGEKIGKIKWQERQDKWLATLDAKSDEEKLEINKKKLLNNSGYSKQSQDLFWNIHKEFIAHNIKFQELSNSEIIMYNKDINAIYKFDYVDFTNKKIIEYNGDFWHCNPILYNENYFNVVKQKTAKEIWEYDKHKNQYIINKGYDLLVIWEYDFKHDRENTIQRCIDFIKNK